MRLWLLRADGGYIFFNRIHKWLVGSLGFEFCVLVAGWRHALRSEWPFIIITSGFLLKVPAADDVSLRLEGLCMGGVY